MTHAFEGVTVKGKVSKPRHVRLPADAKAARVLVSERLSELTEKTACLAQAPAVIPAIARAEATLRRIETMSGNIEAAPTDFGNEGKRIFTSVVWDPTAVPPGNFFHPDTLRTAAGKPFDFFCGGDIWSAAFSRWN